MQDKVKEKERLGQRKRLEEHILIVNKSGDKPGNISFLTPCLKRKVNFIILTSVQLPTCLYFLLWPAGFENHEVSG